MKHFFTLVIMAFTISTFAQNIPNGSFEEWEVRDHFKLDRWYTWTKNVERTTDSKEGNYALKLSNTYVEGASGTRGLARTIDYNNKNEINGLASNADALSLAFWCKYDLAIGDTARVYAVLRQKGVYRGKIDFKFTGSSNNKFVEFSVPIEWGTSGSRQIDTTWFTLYSYTENQVDGDGYVIFDDLHFENIGEKVGTFYNGGFEEWYNIGIDFPSQWRSVDLLAYDSYTNFLQSKSCTLSESGNTNLGANSLVIQNYKGGENVYRGYAFLGDENNDYYTPHFPFADTFRYLQGYYKFLPDGEDTARINVRTYANGGRRSFDDLYLHEEKAEWTFFSIPLSYNNVINPDSASLILYSSYDKGNEHGINTQLYVDQLEFVMEPEPLKLTVDELSISNHYYPNPTAGKLYLDSRLNIEQAEARSTIGQRHTLTAYRNQLDLSNLSDGMYFITIITEKDETITIKAHKKSK